MQAHVGRAASAVQSSAVRRLRMLYQPHNSLVPSKGLEPPHRCRYMDLNHARLPIPPRWQSELQCSGGREAAVSGRPTLIFYSPVTGCQTATSEQILCAVKACTVLPKPESRSPKPRPTPASPSSKFSRSAPSTPDSPSPPPRRTSERPPHPLPEPSPLHRCGST